jgi:hypothetical protein
VTAIGARIRRLAAAALALGAGSAGADSLRFLGHGGSLGDGAGSASCANSDPFLVFGAEKHGFPGINYSRWLDEIRLSDTLRCLAPFAPPAAPFAPDAATAALYHFDEGAGTTTADASGNGASGTITFGGAPPAGPEWSSDSPFGAGAVPGVGWQGGALLLAALAGYAAFARSRR